MNFHDPSGDMPIRMRAVPVTKLTFSSMVRVGMLLGGASSFMAAVLAWGASVGAPESVPFAGAVEQPVLKAIVAFCMVLSGGLVVSTAVSVLGATVILVTAQHMPLGALYFYEQGPPPHPELRSGRMSERDGNVAVDEL